MTTIGSFTLIRNERLWIGQHIKSWLPHLDQMVFYDSSDDGTTEIIRNMMVFYKDGYKIKLVPDKDPKDLKDAYVEMFNECMRFLDTDMGVFAHPDMVLVDPGNLRDLGDAIAASINMVSYAGDPDGPWYEISGRAQKWKNIFRLRGQDLGAHYFGHYGAQNEDVYFSEITGDNHDHYGDDFSRYPYPVTDTGAMVQHFSDVRPYARRLDRMCKCLLAQGYSHESVNAIAKAHPRVTLEKGGGFDFHPVTVLEAKIKSSAKEYEAFYREPANAR